MFLLFQLVRTEELKTAGSFIWRETIFVALKEFEDILDDNGFKIDLLLVVEIFGLEFDLSEVKI